MFKNTRTITVMAVLTAISVVLVAFIHFPLFPAAPFLEYDPADIPILICAFAYGPAAGIIVTVIAAAIQALTVSASGGVYGFIMHVIATTALCLPAGIIYKRNRTRKHALIALIVGTLLMGGVMVIANHFITPRFMGAPTEAVDAMLLPIILPFNLLKAGINSAVTFFIYKPISRYIIKARKGQTADALR
ncbi:MAG: ECF transporter S component [Oscillospiraceae bacterium]|nr:ECF transporter S component [Oscillospiraceae bacterium]